MIIEYQKRTNLLVNTPNEPSKLRKKNQVETNDDLRATYNANSQIKFKTTTLKSSLCDYNDTYILVEGTITVPNRTAPGTAEGPNNRKEKLIFKNCAPCTDCLSKINTTQINNSKDTDVVMPIQTLIEYSNSYSKTSRNVWQFYRDEPSLTAAGAIIDFPDTKNNSALFKFKQKVTGQTRNDGTKDAEVMVLLKYLSNFWRTLEVPLINCEINLIPTWSANCFIMAMLMIVKYQYLQ